MDRKQQQQDFQPDGSGVNFDQYNPGQYFQKYADYFNTEPEAEYNTLDEDISTTVLRDLKRIAHKLKCVLIPQIRQDDDKTLREWDLWGPLLFCMILSFVLSFNTADNDNLFATVFLVIWGGSLVVAINCNLLGGHANILQCLCVLGYCVFPIVLSSILIVVFSVFFESILLKSILTFFAFIWASTCGIIYLNLFYLASIAFMAGMIEPEKRALSVFPVVLFYLFLSWFCLFL